MDSVKIQQAADDIIAQAATAPAPAPGQPVISNTFSPHINQYVYERIRKVLSESLPELEEAVVAEFESLRAESKLGMNGINNLIDNSIAKVKAHLHTFKTAEAALTAAAAKSSQ